MDKIVINGGKRLKGEVRVSGAKNAALPILCSSILAGGTSTFSNVPKLMDVRTTAKVTLEQVESGFDITRIELTTVAEVPGLDSETFARLARSAKDCTVSRALKGVDISLDATLTATESLAGT